MAAACSRPLSLLLARIASRHADSPADKLIALLGDLLAHQQPDARDVVPLLAALKQRHNLYVPTAQDLRAQLVEAAGHDVSLRRGGAPLQGRCKGRSHAWVV